MKNPNLASIKHTAFKKDVYEPSEDSFLLADAILSDICLWDRLPRICVEIGSGSGYVVCSLAKALRQAKGLDGGCMCVATDINPSACEASMETVKNHHVDTNVDIVNCDVLAPFMERMSKLVDVVVFNPPYVVTPDKEVEQGGIFAAWAGGSRGRRIIDRVLPILAHVVCPRGLVYMIAIHDNDPHDIIKIMRGFSFDGKILAKESADEELLYVLKFVRNEDNE